MRASALLVRSLVPVVLVLALLLPSSGAATSPKPTSRIIFSGAAVLYGGGYDRQLYSVLPSGKGAAQLTLGRASASDPVPSPDGRLVLFMRSAAGEPENAGELWVMKPDGSAQRRLTDTASEPIWLPDSRRIAYDVWNSSGGLDGIYTVRSDGRANRLLVKGGRSPAWSANGKTFAYVIPDPLDDHVYVRRNGREFTFVSDTELVDDIAVSPDGRFLAFSAKGEIAVHRFDGEEVEILGRGDGFTGPFPGQSPSWSPRGDRLAFADDAALEVLDVAYPQTKPPLRTLTHERGIRWLAWSPTGNEIVYTRGIWNGFDPTGSIWTASLAGQIRHVSTPVGVAGSIGWSSVQRGLRFKPPLPDSVVANDEVRTRAAMAWFDAEGDRVAYPACGQIDLWSRPGTRIIGLPSFGLDCNPPTGTHASVYSLALARDRVALGTVFGGTSKQSQLVVTSLLDRSVRTVASSYTHERPDVGELVGGGDLLGFSSWGQCLELEQPCVGTPLRDTRVLSTSLWRVRDFTSPGACPHVNGVPPYGMTTAPGPCQELATEPGPFVPMDADSSRLVAVGESAAVILDGNGKRLVTVPVAALAAQLSASDLVVLIQGVLRHYDAQNGAPLHAWPLPDVPSGRTCGVCVTNARLRLEDVARGLAVYILDGKAHILRLADGADAVIGEAKSARFGDSGLFYAYDGAYPWRGRIRFVPFDKLPLR